VIEGKIEGRIDEEDVSSYFMALRKSEVTGT
jgi:hypothetical protein